jgi:hemoglobin/transferrin/lactoferrin receptor protein
MPSIAPPSFRPAGRVVLATVFAAVLPVALSAQGPPPEPQDPAARPRNPEAGPQDPAAGSQGPEAGRGAPEPAPRAPLAGDRVVVTASRQAEPAFDAAFSTQSILAEDLFQRSYRTLPQALRDVPGVMVQETSVSQGSPYIRGFTGYQNLMLVDGVRLNNSVFRSGPNQYWSTVDPLALDRIEIVKGPSSVLYGSDAIGGTVQAFTKDPWTEGAGLTYGGSTYVRYATADESIWGRGELSLGYEHEDGSRTSFLVGGDRKVFGDLEGGRDTGELPYTSYDESSLDLKLIHRFDAHTRLVVAHQDTRQEGAPRTHRTVFSQSWRGTTVGTDLLHEFDQTRRLTYAQLHSEDLGGAVDALRANVSLHTQKEVRDRLRSGDRFDQQGFDVDTYGAWLQLESDSPIGRLTYGAEWYRDEVDSFSTSNPIQGPVGDDASYDLAAVYLQDRIAFDGGLDLTLGGRFNYAAVDAERVQDPVSGDPIAIEDDWSDFVFSARLRYEIVPDRLATYGGISQGFRAPNLSDLTSFDAARSDEFEIPAPGLDSERYLTYEVGLKGRDPNLSWDLAYYWTEIRDQINRFPTGGTNAAGEREVTKDNVGDGHVWGIELAAAYRILDGTTVFGNATYMEGRVDNYQTLGGAITSEYLTRLMPLTVMVGARWEEVEQGRFFAETMVRWADTADKLSSADARDTQRIPPGGTPSYTVWDLGAGWRIDEDSSLNARLENLTDADYRIHGSGTNMPGRNFVIAMQSRF